MFGCCVAGRPLQGPPDLRQVDQTHALFEILAAEKVNHVCVFLLSPFPEGYGATVHFFWPGKGSQILGMLSNEKPSAIFRLRSAFSSVSNPSSGMNTPSAFTTVTSTAVTNDVIANLGFAVEPLEALAAQMAAFPVATINSTLSTNAMGMSSAMTKQLDAGALAERIARHLLNYVSGFVPSGGVGPESMVPMGVIAKWYDNFMGKLKGGGTTFLERDE